MTPAIEALLVLVALAIWSVVAAFIFGVLRHP
jgi:hypothetical protein